jgi:peptidoglycan/xylan/chitin deacetylase (PgdA/CDA1 family)
VSLKHQVFSAVLTTLWATGTHRVLAPATRGRGVILMLHRVRAATAAAFAPNALLEVTPEFLETAVEAVRAAGFDIVTLDEALPRLADPGPRPFAVFTFDDGYRDTLEVALPVLRRHAAPATVYVTPGFADRTASLWWVELERALAASAKVEVDLPGGALRLDCASPADKAKAFETIYWSLRPGPEEGLRTVVDRLARQAGILSCDIADELCLDWEGLAALASDPLVTIGAHTMTHPMLAKHPAPVMETEMAASREAIAARLGSVPRHFAYPVGDPGAAGPREFEAATRLGFTTAVTTRPGMVFAEHAAHLTALPRLSLNGLFQRRRDLDVLLSGVPFMLWNRGRRLKVA